MRRGKGLRRGAIPARSGKSDIVVCASCGNFDVLSNVFCRICGEMHPDPKREARLTLIAVIIETSVYLAANLALVGFSAFASYNGFLFMIPLGFLLLFVMNIQIRKRLRVRMALDSALRRAAYREPVLKPGLAAKGIRLGHVELPESLSFEELGEAMRVGISGASRSIANAQVLYRLSALMMVIHRNLALALELADHDQEGERLLAPTIASARNFYRKHESLIASLVGREKCSAARAALDGALEDLRSALRQERMAGSISRFTEIHRLVSERLDLLEAEAEIEGRHSLS